MKHIICCHRRIIMWMWNILIVEWGCRNMFVRYGEGRANLVLVEEGWGGMALMALAILWLKKVLLLFIRTLFYDDLQVSKCISLSQQECTSWNIFFFLYNSWYEFEWIKSKIMYNRSFSLHNLAYYIIAFIHIIYIKNIKFTQFCFKMTNISLYIIV